LYHYSREEWRFKAGRTIGGECGGEGGEGRVTMRVLESWIAKQATGRTVK